MLFRLLPIFALPLLMAGCQSSSTPPKPGPVQETRSNITDDLGRDIVLKKGVKRLVIIGPGAIETVYKLGAGSLLVGRDSSADFPAAAQKVAVAGDYQGPSVEKCVALHPDLVIVQGETWDQARVDGWQKQIGAPVAALTATSLKEVQADFAKMGVWLGKEAAAKSLAKSLVVPAAKAKLSAFVEIGRSPLFTAGSGTLVSDVLEAGGFSNIAKDVKSYQPFGLESLAARQPSVYVAPTSSTAQTLLGELRATPALSKLKCIQNGRVIAINGDYLLRPGPRLRLGIEQLQQEARRLAGGSSSH